MKIAIQGQQGSYHETAARNLYPECEMMYCQTFDEVFQAVSAGQVAHGLVAIANNRYGFIPESYALLMENAGKTVQITDEYTLSVQHMLLGIEGAGLSDIKEVYSQAPAIGQCRQYLQEHLPHAKIVETEDTAQAAAIVARKQDRYAAAIASEQAGVENKLQILAKGIQDDENNLTRFIVLEPASQQIMHPSSKISVLLAARNETGSLADVLQIFKDLQINLRLIHSSFVANSDFVMKFWIEFDADWRQPKVQELYKQLKEQQVNIIELGKYRKR